MVIPKMVMAFLPWLNGTLGDWQTKPLAEELHGAHITRDRGFAMSPNPQVLAIHHPLKMLIAQRRGLSDMCVLLEAQAAEWRLFQFRDVDEQRPDELLRLTIHQATPFDPDGRIIEDSLEHRPHLARIIVQSIPRWSKDVVPPRLDVTHGFTPLR